jgi:hypothetical protein
VALWSPDTDLDLGENEGEEREMREKKRKVDYTIRFEILWFRYGHYGYGCVTLMVSGWLQIYYCGWFLQLYDSSAKG